MYQLNPLYEFLSESFAKVINRSNTLSPEARQRYLQHYMKARFGGSNLDQTINNYGKRLLIGSGKRIRNIAKKNGRKVKIIRISDPLESRTIINGAIQSPGQLNNKLQQKAISKGKDIIQIPRRNATSNALFSANQAAHEADEYDNVIRQAMKHKSGVDSYAVRDMRSRLGLDHQYSHFRGNVLEKEKKRLKLQDSIFGKDKVKKIPRSEDEYLQSSKLIDSAETEMLKRIENNNKLKFSYDALSSLMANADKLRNARSGNFTGFPF